MTVAPTNPLPLPPPPEGPEALMMWAVTHGVEARLDDLLVAPDGPPGRTLASRRGERLTYRDILWPAPRWGTFYDPPKLPGQSPFLTPGSGNDQLDPDDPGGWRPVALRYLWRMANLTALAGQQRDYLDVHGRPPEDAVLGDFAHRLLTTLRELQAQNEAPSETPSEIPKEFPREIQRAPRPPGTYEPVGVRVTDRPTPMLRYQESPLIPSSTYAEPAETALLCLGWQEGPLRWQTLRGERVSAQEVPPAEQEAALEAMLAFLYDPRQSTAHALLRAHLQRPDWEFALGALDERLRAMEPAAAAATGTGTKPSAAQERLAFRVATRDAHVLDIEPVLQKHSARSGFSKGAKVAWFQLPERKDLSPAERQAYQAYDDRFARRSQAWGGALSSAQLFGILRALVDHPAVLVEGTPHEVRPDIRQGRLRLRFISAADESLTPVFELLGQVWSPAEVAALLRQEAHDDAYLIFVNRPVHALPQILLAQVGPDTTAVIHALRTATRFPPASHDALARRLESLQEKVDIEFPSTWTKTIMAATPLLLARLDLLASGALHIAIGVRPIVHGAIFAPGEGPSLVLEGEGPARHGVRRDLAGERRAAQTLAARLGLTAVAEGEAWSWRVSEGDPALHVVATLDEAARTEAGTDEAGAAEPGVSDPTTGDAATAESDDSLPPVQVEWSGDGRVTFHGGVGLGHMRLKVADRKDWFGVEGGAKPSRKRNGASETVPLSELFAAIREGRRYVAVGRRGFVRIEETLREALARAEESLVPSRQGAQGLQISAASFIGQDPLRQLVADDAQIEASASLRQLLRRLKEPPPETDVEELLGPRWKGILRPYQKAGVGWLLRMAHWGAGVVLADEMGLGKTVQTLAMLSLRASEGPALVVAPTSVVGNWLDEAARFVPELRTNLYRGPDRAALLKGLGPGDLVLTSYTLATLDAEALAGISFASLVLDEAQAVKNAMTERARALRDLNVSWRLGLTGTPIENHLSELWSIFRVIGPGLFGSWEQFRARYAVPIEKFRDDGRRHALARRLRPFVLRRTKAEVAPELPPRTELVRRIQLSEEERGLYEQMRLSTLQELADAKKNPDRDAQDLRFVLLAALTRLRQLCCHPRLVYPQSTVGSSKTTHLLELVASLREDGHRMLVFSQFRTFLDLLTPRLQQHGHRVLVLDGTTPAAARTQRIAAFQRGEADVFLISLKAGGFGLNLTAADTVIHLDPWWNPAVEDQATARAHRIGQDKPVTTLRLVADATVEQAVLGLHAAKRDLAQSILSGSDAAASWNVDTLTDLIRANR